MGEGAMLVQKVDSQRASDAAVSAPQAFMPSWAMDTIAAMRGGLVALGTNKVDNPLSAAQQWTREKHDAFSVWLSQQPIAVETTISSALAAVQGAAAGGLVSTLTRDIVSTMQAAQRASTDLGPNVVMKNVAVNPSPIVQACNFAVLTGTNAGISCILKRVRGVDTMENSLVAAFGSGFLFDLVSNRGALNVASAVCTGALFAFVQGGYYKVSQMMSKDKKAVKTVKEDVYYSKTKNMLTALGLGRYEKNFRRGMLTDYTLPLLTDSALRDVKIPPGPRLIILDHIQRVIPS